MVLDAALWKITEAESHHKHRTRFCSIAVFGIGKTGKDTGKSSRHVSSGLPVVRRLAGSDEFQDGSNKPFWLRGAGNLEFAVRSLRCRK
jgi:hypothetical protein